jgi:hypothetical protein
MPLGLVADVLANGGYLPKLAELEKQTGSIYTRKNGAVFSLFWLLFWLLIMAVVFGGILGIDKLGELFSVIGIFGGLLILLFSLFFLKRSPRKDGFMQQPQMPAHLPGQQHSALPPQQSVPASLYTQPKAGAWRDTNDLQPTSVTEGTTKLLDKDETR